MKAIAAVDKNWGIGRNGQLLTQIPNDMRHFRAETINRAVILGRKTLATFPQARPLSERDNIILSANPALQVRGALVVHSIDELMWKIKSYDTDDVCVIGGAAVYRQLLPFCNTCIITWMDRAFDADTYFPNLDESEEWLLAEESEEQTYFDIAYTFRTYRRKS